ncbi:MAG: hypothetical protein PHQ28_00530 [Mycobacterium sp.]|nr:hypothetical protein [Mycobacterium sp.]
MNDRDRYQTHAYTESRDRGRREHARQDLQDGHDEPPAARKPNVGDRVRVTGVMPEDPSPVPVGTEGTVTWIGQWVNELTRQIGVDWDNGSKLILLASDPYDVLGAGRHL